MISGFHVANQQEAANAHLQSSYFKFHINCKSHQYLTSRRPKTSRDFVTTLLSVWFCLERGERSSNMLWFSAPLGAVMWQRIQICCALFALYSAAPPAHINRLALFPDKSAWCEAKNITQIVGHTGCQPRSIQNRSGWRPSLSCCLSPSLPLSEWQSLSTAEKKSE